MPFKHNFAFAWRFCDSIRDSRQLWAFSLRGGGGGGNNSFHPYRWRTAKTEQNDNWRKSDDWTMCLLTRFGVVLLTETDRGREIEIAWVCASYWDGHIPMIRGCLSFGFRRLGSQFPRLPLAPCPRLHSPVRKKKCILHNSQMAPDKQ